MNRYATCLELRESLVHYRFVRGLHGDAPLLRSLMQEVYTADIEEGRRTLSTLTRAEVKGDALGPRASGVFNVSTEPTISLARSPSSSEPMPLGMRENTEPTELAVKAMFGPRKNGPLLAAAAGIVVAVAAVVVGITWTARQTARDAAATHVAAPAPPPVVPPPAPVDTSAADGSDTMVARAGALVAEPDAGKTRPGKVDAAKPDAGAKPDVAAEAKVAAKVDGAKVDGAKVDGAKVEDAKVDDKVEDAKVDDTVEDAKVDDKVDEKDDAKAAPDSMNEPRVEALLARCPELPCTRTVALHRHDFGALSLDGMRAWIKGLKRCEKECHKAHPEP